MEMGAPGHPGVDQIEAAAATVQARAAQLATSMRVFRVGTDPLPDRVDRFAHVHGGEFIGRTLEKCRHGGNAQPLWIFASVAPHRAFCDRCLPAAERALRENAELAASLGQFYVSCDLCAVPEYVGNMKQFAIAHGHILILGVGCDRCLAVEVPARG